MSSKKELTNIFNSGFDKATPMERNLSSSGGSSGSGPFHHQGVLLENSQTGQSYLAHFAPKAGGTGGDQIIVDSKYMKSSNWHSTGNSVHTDGTSIAGARGAMGTGEYSLGTYDCRHAAEGVMKYARDHEKK